MAAFRPASPPVRWPRIYYGWFVLAAVTFSLCMTFGTTASIGFFFKPLLNEFGWNRASLSGAVSLAYFLIAMLSPLVGRVLDRYGARPVLLLGITAIALGYALLGLTGTLWHVYLFYGVIVAVGAVCTAFVPIATCVMQWFRRRRGTALGISNAGAPLGQLLVVPLASFLILALGWKVAFPTMALILLVTALPLVFLVVRNAPAGRRPSCSWRLRISPADLRSCFSRFTFPRTSRTRGST